jgi:hypothetical protein
MRKKFLIFLIKKLNICCNYQTLSKEEIFVRNTSAVVSGEIDGNGIVDVEPFGMMFSDISELSG